MNSYTVVYQKLYAKKYRFLDEMFLFCLLFAKKKKCDFSEIKHDICILPHLDGF